MPVDLAAYWSPQAAWGGLVIVLHLLGAIGLGVVMGYERIFHGRAAGLRTYALVCMASCALTVATGFPKLWFGGALDGGGDPTRVIQGIVTGIGFLGAGVIMRDGGSIRGLSTAASIWMAAAVGILVGLGLYIPAIAAALITTSVMAFFGRLEAILPREAMTRVTATFATLTAPPPAMIAGLAAQAGFALREWSFASDRQKNEVSVELLLMSDADRQSDLIAIMERLDNLRQLRITPVRD